MIKKYYTGGPWEDVLGEEFDNSLKHVDFNNPDISLSKPGGINLKNVYNNFNIKLKKPGMGGAGFMDSHPYLTDTIRGAKSLIQMGLDSRNMNAAKDAQRDYFNDVRNLYTNYDMKKYGQTPYLTQTATYTDFPNEKVIPFEEEVGGNPMYKKQYQNVRLAKNGGSQLYLAFQDGGSVSETGSLGNLPKYKMGALSPVQKVLALDAQHYGIPMAKKGGNYFVPERLTNNTENFEYYEKPGKFLGYVKDMAQNAILQEALGRKRRGEIEEDMPMAQLGMGMGNFEEFGYDSNNELNDAYASMYNPQTQKQFNQSAPENFFRSTKMAFSKPIANYREKQAEQQQQMNTLLDIYNNMNYQTAKIGGLKRYQTTGVTKPTATTAADFENWYNTTMGNLIQSGASPEQINSFVTQARQWAYDVDNKGELVNPSQLQYQSVNPLTTGSRGDAYGTELETLIQNSEAEFENAVANNADQKTIDAIEAKRTAAMDALNKKYPVYESSNKPDYFYQTPAAPAGAPAAGAGAGAGTGTTTTGAGTQTTTGAGTNQQNYRPMFDPAVMNVLAAMAQGYTKTPFLGFRSNRNMRAMLNQAMAQSLLNYVPGAGTQVGPQGAAAAGTGAGTAAGAGTGTAPQAGMDYNTWIRDNNINRYDITQRPNVYKMRIRANQAGQGLAQVDANGNPIGGGGFGTELLDRLRENKQERILNREERKAEREARKDGKKSEINPKRMERQVKRDYKKFMEDQEEESKYRKDPNSYSPLQPEPMYDFLNPPADAPPLLPGYGPGTPIGPVGVGDIIPPPGSAPAPGYSVPPMTMGPGYQNTNPIMSGSPYTGTPFDQGAANQVMQNDIARDIARRNRFTEIMRGMGSSPEDTGVYGPMDPNTGAYAIEQIPMVGRPATRIASKSANQIPIGSRGQGSASSIDMDAAWRDYMRNKKAYGGSYAMGGMYQQGGVYDLDDSTVEALRMLGYDIEDLQ